MMTNRVGYRRFFFVLICLFPVSVFAGVCPDADLTEDCKVDLYDLDVFVEQWLMQNPEMCDEGGICADFLPPQGVDLIDFTVLATNWWLSGTPSLPLIINEFMASNNSDSDINDP